MSTPNVFDNDMFTMTSLTAAINEVPFVPRRLGELGWFDSQGITTTHVSIEKDGTTLGLVPAKARGSDPAVVNADKRKAIPFEAIHLPQRGAIMADEVQGVRAFGTEDQMQAVEQARDNRLSKMRRNMDATHEHHRIGAIKGQILDADGQRVLVDLYDRFDITQQSVNMAIGTSGTDVKSKCLDVLEKIEDELGDVPFMGVRAFCGKEFWRTFISHPKVKEAYDRWEDGRYLRQDPRDAFEFGGIRWERYRGKVGSVAYVPDEEAFAAPEDVPDMFIARFAPADWMEAVNTVGLPVYAKPEMMRFDKGLELEVQSNPIILNTRPKAVIKLTKSGS